MEARAFQEPSKASSLQVATCRRSQGDFSNPPHCGLAGRRGIFATGAALPKSHSLAQIR